MVIGAIIIVVVLLVLIPAGFLMSMVLLASVLGLLLQTKAENDHADSELLETNY